MRLIRGGRDGEHSCPLCDEPSLAKKGGLCGACQSWWYRTQTMSARDLARYMSGLVLRSTRAAGRVGRLGNTRPSENLRTLTAQVRAGHRG